MMKFVIRIIASLASAGMAGFAGKFFLIGSLLSLGALRPDRECEAMNALSHKASIKVPTIFPISLKKKNGKVRKWAVRNFEIMYEITFS